MDDDDDNDDDDDDDDDEVNRRENGEGGTLLQSCDGKKILHKVNTAFLLFIINPIIIVTRHTFQPGVSWLSGSAK